MRNAEAAMGILDFDFRFQLGHATGLTNPSKPAIDHHGQTRRIVAAIFQPPQSFQQDGYDISLRYSANDSTHIKLREGKYYFF
jgi:hypothetical protein